MNTCKRKLRDNRELTIQRNRQHWSTQDTERRQTKHNTENVRHEQHGPHQEQDVNSDTDEG